VRLSVVVGPSLSDKFEEGGGDDAAWVDIVHRDERHVASQRRVLVALRGHGQSVPSCEEFELVLDGCGCRAVRRGPAVGAEVDAPERIEAGSE
jgi:hypothetical protein